ncbi:MULTISPECIES: GntR family transcriptional regulator [unclassified Ensifer]|uniref:GntR family transcriptional regulator n=1 Tax=unclassified Ensifer TaxID=2633371 RepID=UPI0008132593|nr:MULTISPECIES: GntR family transcriptional regulator [unclassified Ensifer]OCP09698.1 GntR family transcriptional regulator [Ensifer sp. LC13]OCP10806.1 GntR family transcriptional regulator [Ensifer sp. LC11]OCP14086.1 GntR family transcriptional regulator [Ensifer sp. LC14]OCP32874.1 GntR family transcriptional regulator [Ensifer sp. LC499]
MSLTTTPPSADLASDPASDTGSQHIRDTLRDAIVERRLAPGTKLSESDVGELFNVSRTLVRAALQALSYEGLVNVEKNRGAFVAHPSIDEARQIFATRRLIEPGVVRSAAANIGKAEVAELRRMLAAERQLTEQRGQSARRAEIKASGDFHLALADLSGNSILRRFMDELVARSSLVIALYGQSTVSSCGHSEHDEIVNALERGDIDAAARLMVHHIDHIEADLDLRVHKSTDLKAALEL